MIMIGIFTVIAVGMTILAARRGYRERLMDDLVRIRQTITNWISIIEMTRRSGKERKYS
ncbi:hypothetical protein [Exiguobacterium sp. s138]|uniref:hypothetical protein n=1 Tax=Exiguobacterium sp. s138 TaxID=2751202 RepID=UPI001BEA6A91|nr:hypothetical protein [Exiguobacterium sp. s138]